MTEELKKLEREHEKVLKAKKYDNFEVLKLQIFLPFHEKYKNFKIIDLPSFSCNIYFTIFI